MESVGDQLTMAQNPDFRPTDKMTEKLPSDIFFDILSRLPITDTLECKYVCWQWRNSVQDPAFANVHLSRAAKNSLGLIVQSKYRYSTSNSLHILHMDDFDSSRQMMKKINLPYQWLMYKFKIVGSCNGLLCLYNTSNDGPIFLYNPFTREHHKLPKVNGCQNSLESSVVFGFGIDPITSAYKVIKVIYDKVLHLSMGPISVRSEVWVFTMGSNKWRSIGSTPYRLFGLSSEVLVDGKLHWLAQSCISDEVQIVSLDLEKEEFQYVAQPDCGSLGCPYYYHLVALRGCLSIVVTSPAKTTEVWMMKNYNVKESWTKEFVIGKHVPEGIWCSDPPISIMKNCSNKRYIQVLSLMQSGEILLLYASRKLVAFHPQHRTFRPLELDGLPYKFHMIVHVGSLVSMNAAVK